MKKSQIEALALEAAKGIKTEQDLNDFRRMMTKITVEAALNAELDDHLGYGKHERSSSDNRVLQETLWVAGTKSSPPKLNRMAVRNRCLLR